MKAVISVSLALLALVFCLPQLLPAQNAAAVPAAPVESPAPSESAAPLKTPPPQTPVPTPPPPAPPADKSFELRLSRDGYVETVSMDEYLFGVVAAEMPASFEPEALKAQAVAARTYAMYEIRTGKHEGFDLCSSPACCSAFANDEKLREGWGGRFDTYAEKIRAAVKATDGLYLAFEDKPILAVFHASSYGCTEASGVVWSSQLPYLVSAPTPETPENVDGLLSTVTVLKKNFTETILASHPEAVFDDDAHRWFALWCASKSGCVTSVRVGGVKMTGQELRGLFELRSAAFTVEITDDAVVFHVSGYGHGVGLSQQGANLMAKSGATFDKILENYYKGASISRFSGNFGT